MGSVIVTSGCSRDKRYPHQTLETRRLARFCDVMRGRAQNLSKICDDRHDTFNVMALGFGTVTRKEKALRIY